MDAEVVDIPCACALHAKLDPTWEGFPCACRGAETVTVDGRPCVVAYIASPYRQAPKPESTLAELCLTRPDDMTLPQWIQAIRAEAENVLHPKGEQ